MRRGRPSNKYWQAEGYRNFKPRTPNSLSYRPHRPFPQQRFPFNPPFRGALLNRPRLERPQLERPPFRPNSRGPRWEHPTAEVPDNHHFKSRYPPPRADYRSDHRENYPTSSRAAPPWQAPPRPHLHPYDYPNNEDNRNCLPSLIHTSPLMGNNYDRLKLHDDNNQQKEQYDKSICDTVDIIKKKLMERKEVKSTETYSENNVNNNNTISGIEKLPVQRNTQVRVSRHVHKPINIIPKKENADNMKKSIVQQLFKMDRKALSKLVDDPQSSTKFECAIDSLILESRNSLNRHLRNAAEKSLIGQNTQQLAYNNNEILFDDTFMKQMQCILEPSDSVNLSDIKPLVMAELSKVLELDEITKYELQQPNLEFYNYEVNNEYNNDLEYDFDNLYTDFSQDIKTSEVSFNDTQCKRNISYSDDSLRFVKSENIKSASPHDEILDNNEHNVQYFHNTESQETRCTAIEQFDQLNVSNERYNSNIDSEEFGENEISFNASYDFNDYSNQDLNNLFAKSIKEGLDATQTELLIPEINYEMQTEVIKTENVLNTRDISEERTAGIKSLEQTLSTSGHKDCASVPSLSETESSTEKDKNVSSQNTNKIKCSPDTINSRKRECDDKISHRKEKRKKVDINKSEGNKQLLNKSITNFSDCDAKKSDKCEVGTKSVFNLFANSNQNKSNALQSPQKKKNETASLSYSNKYVKRKEGDKKKNSTSPNKKIETHLSNDKLTPQQLYNRLMADNKISKEANSHLTNNRKTRDQSSLKINTKPCQALARKGTLQKQSFSPKITDHGNQKPQDKTNHISLKWKPNVNLSVKRLSKSTQTVQNRFVTKSVQTLEKYKKKLLSRDTQTEATTQTTVSIQTEDINIKNMKNDDILERMKQIDLEIQILIQEKFKLYNSLESTVTTQNTNMDTFGMTVVNMPSISQTEDFVETGVNIGNVEIVIPEESSQSQIEINSESAKTTEQSPDMVVTGRVNTRFNRKKLQETNAAQPLTGKKNPTRVQKPRTYSKKPKKTVAKNIRAISDVVKECTVLLTRQDFTYLNKNKSELEPIIQDDNVLEVCCVTDEMENDVVLIENIETVNLVDGYEIEMTAEFDLDGNSIHILDTIADNEIDMIHEEVVIDANDKMCEDNSELTRLDNVPKTYDFTLDGNHAVDAVTVNGHGDAVIAVECIRDNFLAASLDGNVYYFNGRDGHLLRTLRGSNLPVTCLNILELDSGNVIVYTGSLDSRIRSYNLESGREHSPECNVLSPIQTMDRAWDTIFVGTRTGFVLQFECKNDILIPVSSMKFSDQAILAIRAIKEGPRKVLLVASRSENVTIKDAQTGLLLRTLYGPKMTVYTLLFENGKVFCGTSGPQIQVFDYTSGNSVGVHNGGRGAVCLKAAGGLLFAGCYDGCIYIYRPGETDPIAQLRGPNIMLLSLAVIHSKIIAGYKDKSLFIWKIPLNILQEMIL